MSTDYETRVEAAAQAMAYDEHGESAIAMYRAYRDTWHSQARAALTAAGVPELLDENKQLQLSINDLLTRADAQRADLDDMRVENERLVDVERRLNLLLWKLTNGKLSKTGYDVRTMVQAIEAEFEDGHLEDTANLRAELDAARATLAEVRELTEVYHEYGTHPSLNPDDGQWAILRADLVAERLLAILEGETNGCGEC